jgi:hypothetical protein
VKTPQERWWLSFASNETGKSLGAAIVEVPDGQGFLAAVHKAHKLGINPGGEVEGVAMSTQEDGDREVEEMGGLNQLIPRQRLIDKGYRPQHDPPPPSVPAGQAFQPGPEERN